MLAPPLFLPEVLDALSSWHAADGAWTDGHESRPESMTDFAAAGFIPGGITYLHHTLDLAQAIEPVLPAGYRFATVRRGDADRRAELHRARFLPYSSRTAEVAQQEFRQLAEMPEYIPDLDIVVEAAGGTWVAETIAWVDRTTAVGLLEPVGSRPGHRRRGRAAAAVAEALRRLHTVGMAACVVNAMEPGEGSERPAELAASRLLLALFAAAGFGVTRRLVPHRRTLHIAR